MNRLLSTLFLTGLVCILFSQSSYQKRISSEADIVGLGITFLQDSTLAIVLQHTETFGSDYRLSIMRTTAEGEPIWTKQFLESVVFTIPSVITVSTGGILVVTELGNPQAVMAIRLDADGDSLWTKTYPALGSSLVPDVIESSDGGYVIANNSFSKHLISKLDADGNLVWSRTCSGDDTAEGNVLDLRSDVIETWDGAFVSVGYGFTDEITNSNTFIQKTDAEGNPVWNVISGGDAQECYRSVVELADSTLLAVGYSKSFGDGNDDVLLSRFSSNGVPIWSKTMDSGENDQIMTMERMDNGQVILSGYARDDGSIPQYNMIIGLDSLGELLWSRKVVGETTRILASTKGSENDVYMTGVQQVGPSDFDGILFRADSTGFIGCNTDTLLLEVEEPSLSFAIAELVPGGLDTTDYSAPFIHGEYELITICDTSITGLTSSALDHDYQVYLNPTTKRLVIRSDDRSSVGAQANIYSVEGRLVKNTRLTDSFYHELDLSDRPSGIYLFQLILDGSMELNGRIYIP